MKIKRAPHFHVSTCVVCPKVECHRERHTCNVRRERWTYRTFPLPLESAIHSITTPLPTPFLSCICEEGEEVSHMPGNLAAPTESL